MILRKKFNRVFAGLQISALILFFTGFFAVSCGKPTEQVLIDGSSTVYPISEAVAETYRTVDESLAVTVGTSGTGGGFKKFCNGETDISDASRPIKSKEMDKCKEAGVEFVEIPVAYDGLAIVINPKNTFIQNLNIKQINHIFRYEDPAKTWKDVDPSWPDKEIKIFAPGQDSGTYDYFVEAIIGKEGRVRADATFSEDDNVLVTGVSGEEFGIGFFGLAYYEENQDLLKVVPIVNPEIKKGIVPSKETVMDGTYMPMSRPLFIYVRSSALDREAVRKFVTYYISQAGTLAAEVGYVSLGDELYALMTERLKSRSAGSRFGGEHIEGANLLNLYRQ